MRRSEVFALIGDYQTGKTTKAKDIMNHIIKTNPGDRGLVLTPDDSEWIELTEIDPFDTSDFMNFTGIRKVIVEDKDILDRVTDPKYGFRKGVVLFDDSRTYIEDRVDTKLRKMVLRPRQRMIDIIFVAHGFEDLPPKLIKSFSIFYLFQSLDNIDSRKKYFKNFERLKAAQTYVDNEITNRKEAGQPAKEYKHLHKIVKV